MAKHLLPSAIDVSKLDLSLDYHAIGSSMGSGAVQKKVNGSWETVTVGPYWDCNALVAQIEKLKREP